MLADVADTSRTVRPEKKGENLPDEIGVSLAAGYIPGTFGARAVTLTPGA